MNPVPAQRRFASALPAPASLSSPVHTPAVPCRRSTLNPHGIQTPAVLALATAAAFWGCGSSGGGASTSAASVRGFASADRPPGSRPTIDPANFESRVTNPYLPLVPGTAL